MPGQDLGVAEIVFPVAAAGGADAERERPNRAPSRPQRDEQRRAQLERAKELEVLVARGDHPQLLVGHTRKELALSADDRPGQPDRCIGQRAPSKQRGLELLAPPRRVDPRSNPPQLAVGRDAVERRDVGERRHDELQQPRHGVLDQQRAVRDLARGGE